MTASTVLPTAEGPGFVSQVPELVQNEQRKGRPVTLPILAIDGAAASAASDAG